VQQTPPHKRTSDQTIFSWRRQDRIESGEQPRLTTKEKSELTTANKRTAELETELKIARRGSNCSRRKPAQQEVRGGRSDRR
jgi:transposase-like protein